MSTNDGGTGSKMTWDDWSDLQVNKAVAELYKVLVADEDFNGYFHSYREKYPSTIWVAKQEFGNQTEPWEQVNYVLIPEDMWPIMLENGISLTRVINSGEHMYCAHDGYWHHGNFIDSNIEYCHANPLRAVAIVFLEINGVTPNA